MTESPILAVSLCVSKSANSRVARNSAFRRFQVDRRDTSEYNISVIADKADRLGIPTYVEGYVQ